MALNEQELENLITKIQRSYGGVSMFKASFEALNGVNDEDVSRLEEALRILNVVKQPALMFELNKEEAIQIIEGVISDLESNVSSVKINYTPEEYTIYVDSPTEITCTVLPESADDKSVTWESSDEDNVTIEVVDESTINISSSVVGTFSLTCTSVQNNEIFDTVNIEITEPVEP